jgi:hypothetical protein
VKPAVLSRSQVEQFIELGHVVVRDAFPRSVAARVRALIWKELKLHPEEPSGWTKSLIHLHENFSGEPFDAAYTPRVTGAFDDLMGEGRWVRNFVLGWWPVAFPGFEKPPWKAPNDGWHIDGSHFHHHLTSREQGLLPIFIFSDIGSGDGGTALSERSHHITARILSDAEPDGLGMSELTRRVNLHPNARAKVVEATGNAGDVVLIHPFLLHGRSPNTGPHVRFICNPCFALHEPMNFNRTNSAEYSPVEQAVVNALRGN